MSCWDTPIRHDKRGQEEKQTKIQTVKKYRAIKAKLL